VDSRTQALLVVKSHHSRTLPLTTIVMLLLIHQMILRQAWN